MSDRILCSGAAFLLAVLVCACGGSAVRDAPGGASTGGTAGKGASGTGNASSSIGGSGSTAASNPEGSSGMGTGGAPNTPASCPAVTPCGGNVVGDWTIWQMCLDTSGTDVIAERCPGASVTITPFTATGTLSFKADNTMTSTATISFEEYLQIPPSCITQDECNALVSQLNGPGITNAHCAYNSTTGCFCSLTSIQPTMSSGTYQVDGNNLMITTASTGVSETDTFCVSGNTLSIHGVSDTGSEATVILKK